MKIEIYECQECGYEYKGFRSSNCSNCSNNSCIKFKEVVNERISLAILHDIALALSTQFEQIKDYTIEDWSDLDMAATEILTEEQYKRFNQMLHHVYRES